jgi:hypothetical protein
VCAGAADAALKVGSTLVVGSGRLRLGVLGRLRLGVLSTRRRPSASLRRLGCPARRGQLACISAPGATRSGLAGVQASSTAIRGQRGVAGRVADLRMVATDAAALRAAGGGPAALAGDDAAERPQQRAGVGLRGGGRAGVRAEGACGSERQDQDVACSRGLPARLQEPVRPQRGGEVDPGRGRSPCREHAGDGHHYQLLRSVQAVARLKGCQPSAGGLGATGDAEPAADEQVRPVSCDVSRHRLVAIVSIPVGRTKALTSGLNIERS